MIFLQLFYTFFKIGLFGFGGGYAMLSMIQGEVVTRHEWLTPQEFTDIVAISQMTPGPIGINSATYDFSDELVKSNWGVQLGFEWRAFSHLNVFADVQWGLNSAFPKDFDTITFKMYPIYGNLGFAYAF